jgi:hypothetical protein
MSGMCQQRLSGPKHRHQREPRASDRWWLALSGVQLSAPLCVLELVGGADREQSELGEWCTQVAPSTALRKWYDHHPERFEEFSRRYRAELEDPSGRRRCSTHGSWLRTEP